LLFYSYSLFKSRHFLLNLIILDFLGSNWLTISSGHSKSSGISSSNWLKLELNGQYIIDYSETFFRSSSFFLTENPSSFMKDPGFYFSKKLLTLISYISSSFVSKLCSVKIKSPSVIILEVFSYRNRFCFIFSRRHKYSFCIVYFSFSVKMISTRSGLSTSMGSVDWNQGWLRVSRAVSLLR
jgi:hypothetical protein